MECKDCYWFSSNDGLCIKHNFFPKCDEKICYAYKEG